VHQSGTSINRITSISKIGNAVLRTALYMPAMSAMRYSPAIVTVALVTLILRQSRRELLWLGVTAHPNAEWLARQLTEACGWDEPPRLIRDRDGAYGAAFIRRIRAIGIRDRPVSARRLGRTDMRRG
jgi:hypothetical protein